MYFFTQAYVDGAFEQRDHVVRFLRDTLVNRRHGEARRTDSE